MTNKATIQIASRAIALNLLLWSITVFAYVPGYSFSLSHYARVAAKSESQLYLYRYYCVMLASHLFICVLLFCLAIWLYRCAPVVEAFLSPSEE
jgi:hypothetical protein